MKRIAALMLGLLMTLTCVAGVVSASAEDVLPEAVFTYDFTVENAASLYGFSDFVDCDVTYDGAGYITFTAAADDPEPGKNPDCYFKFGVQSQPDLACNQGKFVVIKYRIDTDCYGQIYTARTDSTSWGDWGNSRTWDWEGDGEWNLALVDASSGWGSVDDGIRFESFRFDPIGGAEDGTTIDIAFIKFFSTKEDAKEFRRVSDPEKYTFYTVTFLREDGSVLREIEYQPGDTKINKPSVPKKDGYTGAWEPFDLSEEKDWVVRPVYTNADGEVETFAPLAETTTAAAVEEGTTEAAVESTAAAVDTADGADTVEATEAATTKGDDAAAAGCKSVIASASVLAVVALAAGVVVARKKND